MSENNPEISLSAHTGPFDTNYHDWGSGKPVLMLHGSGPGVSAWSTWGKIIPALSQKHRLLAPDLAGFGYTRIPDGFQHGMDHWLKQIVDFLDVLNLEKVDLVGYSFGGALALGLAVKYPQKVRRMVLMGSMGVKFHLTLGLDKVWSCTPTIENMRSLLDLLVYSSELVNNDMAQARLQASLRPGVQQNYSSMFPSPRQKSINDAARFEDQIKDIRLPTLIMHGRDDRVIPLETSLKLHRLIEDSQLHVFGRCGHWIQFEKRDDFIRLTDQFLAE